MSDSRKLTPDIGLLLLRVSIGGLMLFHGIAKISGGVDSIKGMLDGKGLPAFMAYGVYLGEVVAPILILIGVFTRPAAVVLAGTMVMSIWLAFGLEGFELTNHGAPAVELNLMYLLGSLTLLFTGAGALSVRKGAPRWD